MFPYRHYYAVQIVRREMLRILRICENFQIFTDDTNEKMHEILNKTQTKFGECWITFGSESLGGFMVFCV